MIIADHANLAKDIRYFRYERLTRYVTEPLLVRKGNDGAGVHRGDGSVGWITRSDGVVLIEPGGDGTIFLDPETVVAASVLHRRPNLSRAGIQTRDGFKPYRPDQVTTLDIEATVSFNPGWHNYFHWMVEVLPLALHSADVFPGSELLFADHGSFRDRLVPPSFSRQVWTESMETVVGGLAPVRILHPRLLPNLNPAFSGFPPALHLQPRLP